MEKSDKTMKIKSCYKPIKLRREKLAKTGGKCAYPNCNKSVELFHHTDRFLESQNHESILPFCKIHHEFVHNGLIENETENPQKGELKIADADTSNLNKADILYREKRKVAI